MNRQQRDKWNRALYDALERIQDALKKLGTDDVDEVDSLVMDAQARLRVISEDISREQQMGDPGFLQSFSQSWFREAEILHQFIAAFPETTLLEEGTYHWRIRSVQLPPLQMPTDYDHFKDGPCAEVTVGSNSEYVAFEMRVLDSGKQT